MSAAACASRALASRIRTASAEFESVLTTGAYTTESIFLALCSVLILEIARKIFKKYETLSVRMSNPVDLNALSKDGVLAASEEAANAPTLFSPRERATYVRERVAEIRRLRSLGQSDLQIKEAMGTFVTQYPTLFQMCVEPHFDESKLKMMLGVMDKMASSGMTQHQASVIVGQSLVDSYVKPMIESKKK